MFANKGNINIAVMLRHFFFDHENRFYPNTCDTPFLDCAIVLLLLLLLLSSNYGI